VRRRPDARSSSSSSCAIVSDRSARDPAISMYSRSRRAISTQRPARVATEIEDRARRPTRWADRAIQ
jgi:hypothetical protein